MKNISFNYCLTLGSDSLFEKRFIWVGEDESSRDNAAEAIIAIDPKAKEAAKTDPKKATEEPVAEKAAEGNKAVRAGMGDLKVAEQAQYDKSKAEQRRAGMGDVKLAEQQEHNKQNIVKEARAYLKNKVDSQAITRDEYDKLGLLFVDAAESSNSLREAAQKVYEQVSAGGPTKMLDVVLSLIQRDTPKPAASETKEKAPLTVQQRLDQSIKYVNGKFFEGKNPQGAKEWLYNALNLDSNADADKFALELKEKQGKWFKGKGVDAIVGGDTFPKLQELIARREVKTELPRLAKDINNLQTGELIAIQGGGNEKNGEKIVNGKVAKIVEVKEEVISVETARGNRFDVPRGKGLITILDKSDAPEKFAAAQKKYKEKQKPETPEEGVARVTLDASKPRSGRSSGKSE